MVVGADVTVCGTKAQYPPAGQAVQSEEDVDPVLLVYNPKPQDDVHAEAPIRSE